MLSASKEMLARLLATEDITVVQANAKTASFDLKERVLTLPSWDNMDKDTYDHMTGHEVAHALYTPVDEWKESIERVALKVGTSERIAQGFINVVEDARIEKLIQRRYPGLRRAFIRSYRKLLADGFFEGSIEVINERQLADRLNVYFKCGVSAGVQFSDDERIWIDRIANAETFAEVEAISADLIEYTRAKNQEDAENQEESESLADALGEGEEEEDLDDEGFADDLEEGEEGEESDPIFGGKSYDPGSSFKQEEEGDDIDEVVTERALRENIEREFGSDTHVKNYTTPVDDGNRYVIGYKSMLKVLDNPGAFADKWSHNEDGTVKDWYLNGVQQIEREGVEKWNEFRSTNKQAVDYMVKEFEMRKSASEYARTSTSKTGTLDTLKMNNYRFDDDIFRRIEVVADGKNHGFLMYIDWSGSMSGCVRKTVEQVLTLTMFCRQVNIPFRVFAFSNVARGDEYMNAPEFKAMTPKRKLGACHFEYDFALLEFFSNKMTNAQNRRMASALLAVADCHDSWDYRRNSGIHIPQPFNLGGTPYSECILAAGDVHDAFVAETKVDITNTFFLTDGMGAEVEVLSPRHPEGEYSHYILRHSSRDSIVKLTDLKTKKTYRLRQRVYHAFAEESSQDTLLRMYKDRTGSNVVGYSIIDSNARCFQNTVNQYIVFQDIAKYGAKMRKEKYVNIDNSPYDLYFVMRKNDLETKTTDLEVKGEATKGKLRTAFKKSQGNRKGSRAMLNELMALVS